MRFDVVSRYSQNFPRKTTSKKYKKKCKQSIIFTMFCVFDQRSVRHRRSRRLVVVDHHFHRHPIHQQHSLKQTIGINLLLLLKFFWFSIIFPLLPAWSSRCSSSWNLISATRASRSMSRSCAPGSDVTRIGKAKREQQHHQIIKRNIETVIIKPEGWPVTLLPTSSAVRSRRARVSASMMFRNRCCTAISTNSTTLLSNCDIFYNLSM